MAIQYVNSSRDRRPDVVTRDFLTSFAMGPIGLQVADEGLIYQPWKIRTDGRYVYLAKPAADGWDDEALLFDSGSAGIVELDIAFTQNADPVVCFEKDGHVWLYWYDPTVAEFVLTDHGVGRTPRVILDEPFDTEISDVQFFYISQPDDAIVYRQQRDRYATRYLTPFIEVEDTYLEDVFRDWSLRLHLLISVRNQVSGQYRLEARSSNLFPAKYRLVDSLDVRASISSAESHLVFLTGLTNVDELDIHASIADGSSIVAALSEFEIDADITFDSTLQLLDLVDVVIATNVGPESVDVKGTIANASTVVVVIVNTIPVESLDVKGTIASATSVVV